MFGNKYFGKEWFAETYFGPVGERATGGLTPAEAEGLDSYGRAKLGIKNKPELPEVSILDVEIPEVIDVQSIPESELVPVSHALPTLQDKIDGEEDILLILSMIEAHEN